MQILPKTIINKKKLQKSGNYEIMAASQKRLKGYKNKKIIYIYYKKIKKNDILNTNKINNL